MKTIAIKAGRGTVVGRSLLEGRIVQVPDVLADSEYTWTEAQERIREWPVLQKLGSCEQYYTDAAA